MTMTISVTAAPPKRRRLTRAALAALVALAVCLSAALAAPEPAHAFDGSDWQANIDNRKAGTADSWDDEWLGGDKYPVFDILQGQTDIGACLTYWVYSNVIEGASSSFISTSSGLLDAVSSSSMLENNFDGTEADGSEGAFATVYRTVSSISNNVVQPVAEGFLGLACVLALLEFSKEVATNKGDHFSMAGNYVWIIVKFALIGVLISHIVMLCGGVYEVFLWVAKHVSATMSSAGISAGAFDSFMIQLQKTSYREFGSTIVLFIVAGAMCLTTAVTVVKVAVLTVTRMFEIYVMTAFAGFPLVMVTTRETRPSGIGYFKKLGGVCLQAAVLIVIIGFAGVFFSAATAVLSSSMSDGFIGSVVSAIASIAGCYAFSVMASQSRHIADTIMGAMG